jgi:hypothetical protein
VKGQGRIVAVVASIIVLLGIGMWLLVLGASHLPLGPRVVSGNSYVGYAVLMFGAFVMTWLFTIFLWNGVAALVYGEYISKLHWPMTFTKGMFALYVDLLAARALDLTIHRQEVAWVRLFKPGTRLLDSLFLLVIFGGFAWITGVLVTMTEKGTVIVRWNLRIYLLTLALVIALGAVVVGILVYLSTTRGV